MLESGIEKRLKGQVKKHGGKALKFVSPGMRGVPDRIVLLPGGKMVFVELKAPGKVLGPLQEKRCAEFQELGFKVYRVDSVAALHRFIAEVFGK